MVDLRAEIRFALRTMRSGRSYTLAAITLLALAIGANTAIFTIVNAAFFHALPYRDAHELVAVFSVQDQEYDPGSSFLFPLSFPNYRSLLEDRSLLADAAAFTWLRLNLSGGEGRPERVFGHIVTSNYFDVLGVSPAVGREFSPDDDNPAGGRAVAVLSHGLWQRRFAGDPTIVGRSILLNNREFEILGVAPPEFKAPQTTYQVDLWIPMSMFGQTLGDPDLLEMRSENWFNVVGRLGADVTPENALSGLRTVSARLRRAYPEVNRNRSFVAVPVDEANLDPNKHRTYVQAAILLMSAVGVVFLIAVANVGNLLLSRAVMRRREIAIRRSLGASPARLVRQLLTEGILLGLAAGGLGLLLALILRALLWNLRPPYVGETALDLSLHPGVLLFALLLSLLAGIGSGLVPALQAARTSPAVALKGGDEGGEQPWRLSFRNLLIAAQVALCIVSLTGGGLMVKSLRNLRSSDPGFESERLASMSFDTAAQGYEPGAGRQFYRRVLERLQALPGVESVALAQNPLLETPSFIYPVEIEGRRSDPDLEGLHVLADVVSVGYFETMGIPLLRGRVFTRQDREDGRRVGVVNETMAERFWPGDGAVGQRFYFNGEENPIEVIGVVADGKYVSLREDPRPYIYLPLRQRHTAPIHVRMRTAGPPGGVLGDARREIQALDRNLPIEDVMVAADAIEASLWASRMGASMLGILAATALVLAAGGIAASMFFFVGQRRREMGIRLTVGADRRDILLLVVKEGMLVIGVGIVLGFLGAFLFGRAISRFLYGLESMDPLTLVQVVLTLTVIGLASLYPPAHRASRTDPVESIRLE